MLDGVVIDDTKLFNDKLQEWEDFYNFHRPHGGLDGQTPYERLRQKTTTRRKRPPSVAQTAGGRIRTLMPLRAVPCGHVPTTGFAGSTLEMKQRMRQSSVGRLLPKEALSTVFGTPRAGGSRMFRRRGKRASLTDRALAEADALVRAKKPIDAIRLLSNTNRTNATLGWSVVLSPFDWTAFRETSWSPSPAAWPEPVEDLFPGERIPEIGRSDLTADIVRSAIRNHGSLLVHGLVDSGPG